MNKKFTTSQITLLGLMIAILLLMAYTPLGYLNIGLLQSPLILFRLPSAQLQWDL